MSTSSHRAGENHDKEAGDSTITYGLDIKSCHVVCRFSLIMLSRVFYVAQSLWAHLRWNTLMIGHLSRVLLQSRTSSSMIEAPRAITIGATIRDNKLDLPVLGGLKYEETTLVLRKEWNQIRYRARRGN